MQKESYVTLCMCRRTLVWTVANFHKATGMPTRSSFTGLDPLSCWLASLLRCLVSTRVTLRQLPTSQSLFVSLSDWRPLTTSGHVEIAGPKPFVWFRAKTDKGIVCLADHLHSVTRSTTEEQVNSLKPNSVAEISSKEYIPGLVSPLSNTLDLS